MSEHAKGLGWTQKGCVISSKEFKELRDYAKEKFLPHTYKFPYTDKTIQGDKVGKRFDFPSQTEKKCATRPPRARISSNISYLYEKWNSFTRFNFI